MKTKRLGLTYKALMLLYKAKANQLEPLFKFHYTGIDTLEHDSCPILGCLHFYVQRDHKTKKISYLRLDTQHWVIKKLGIGFNWGTSIGWKEHRVWFDINNLWLRPIIKPITKRLESLKSFIKAVNYRKYEYNYCNPQDPEYEPLPSWIAYAWKLYRMQQQVKKCQHPNMESDLVIGPESGHEYVNCPDCGYANHIYYY